ncbi:cobalamin-dependent methionine synthase I [Desulfosporosinus acidiphilus SJ4]|uniref:Cobalamin-dependent methionine synthase I n=1 Tax=Desulfosporosinus acidiphilus (strain DSM 22704 / JCM 16185 / SJ4) TaxID=646529 RepID=I4D0R7_DESAJ|nr:homocysteine S-methyltransferase family protein [Desulfosporosinus acidiphilus]AFM39391.1 cobalamin-dependent methionine synthase I [Desulfosporosinus acidiphilus SJ4]
MKDFLSSIQQNVLLYDGSKGVMLQRKGLSGHEASEAWNLSHPEIVRNLYVEYRQAGSDIIQTNTFPGNKITLDKHGLGDKTYELVAAGVKLAREAAGEDTMIAASLGPTGTILEPSGDLSFEEAYDVFHETLKAVEAAGADLVNFETFIDLNELRAAVLAAKETTKLPIIASATFESNGRTTFGNSPESCAIACQSLGAAMVGANCSGGPDSLIEPIKKMYTVASVPLCVKPNAGMPELLNGEIIYRQTPEQFSSYTKEFVENGVRLIGGCCGTSPEFIRELKKALTGLEIPEIHLQSTPTLASAFNHLVLSPNQEHSVKRLSQDAMTSLIDGNFSSLARECRTDAFDYLLLDFGNIAETFFDVIDFAGQFGLTIRKPVVLKAESPEIIEQFLRYYPGRAGVVVSENSKLSISRLEHYGAFIVNGDSDPFLGQ